MSILHLLDQDIYSEKYTLLIDLSKFLKCNILVISCLQDKFLETPNRVINDLLES